MASKSSSTARKFQIAKEYLLANPSASNEQVVQALNVSPRTVTNARQTLIAMGLLSRSYFDRVSGKPGQLDPKEQPEAPTGSIQTGDQFASEMAASEKTVAEEMAKGFTIEQLKIRFSEIARIARKENAGALEIAALQAIARLDQQAEGKTHRGPGTPLTRAAKEERIAPLMEACGPSICASALVRAFERPELDRLIDELGRCMARKVEDGQPTEENRAESHEQSAPSDPIS